MARSLKIFSFVIIAALFATLVAWFFWARSLESELVKAIEDQSLFESTTVYSRPYALSLHDKVDFDEVLDRLRRIGVTRARDSQSTLRSGDYRLTPCGSATCLEFVKEGVPHRVVVEGLRAIALQVGDEVVESLTLPGERLLSFVQGQMLARNYRVLEDFPASCRFAVVAIEDQDFLNHQGFRISSLLRAVKSTLLEGNTQGGSTITMQLIKNLLFSPERTLSRKVKELTLAPLLEARLPKDKILEYYLNVIYMGQDGPFQIRGYPAAAQYYFSKSIEKLSPQECATLAAVLNGPGVFNPFAHPERTKKRRDLVLSKMANLGHLGLDEASTLRDLPLSVKKTASTAYEPLAYYIDAIRSRGGFEKLPKELHTYLDPKIQIQTQEVVTGWSKKLSQKTNTKVEVAAMIVDLQSHSVLALSGGSGFKLSPFNRAVVAKRQMGSLIKPLVHLHALVTKSPIDLIEDTPFTLTENKKTWSPQNYDKQFRGNVTLAQALAQSLNVPSVRLLQEIGPEKALETLRQLGISPDVPALPSLALGAIDVSLFEVMTLYSFFLSRCEHSPLKLYQDLADSGPTVSTRIEPFEPKHCSQLIEMLRAVPDWGTARALRAQFSIFGPLIAKTGTSNEEKDSWLVVGTPRYLIGVWAGNDKAEPIGLTGASGALPVVADLIQSLKLDDTSLEFPIDRDLFEERVIEIEPSLESKTLKVLRDPKDQFD